MTDARASLPPRDRLSAPRLSGLIRGYHGTTKELAETYASTGTIPASRKPSNWLGDGVYFWEEGRARAVKWAIARHHADAAVVSARIRPARCVNLFDAEWPPVLTDCYQSLCAYRTDSQLPMPKNVGRHRCLDREIITWLCERKYDVDTVRAPFLEGPRLFPASMFQALTHIQIAVRTPGCILDPVEIVWRAGD